MRNKRNILSLIVQTDSLPLRNIKTDKIKDFLAGDDWFRIQTSGPITADIIHPKDCFLCRLEAPKHNDVVQLSCGQVESTLADSLFSPEEDWALQFKGKDIRLAWKESEKAYTVSSNGPLFVRIRKDYFKKYHNLKYYHPLDKKKYPRPAAGWCSWYYYYLDIDEKEVLNNVEWLKNNLAPFGLSVVQIDDGWQGRGYGQGDNRNWFMTCKEKFPNGMKELAGKIRQAGFIPGIWLIPFTQSSVTFFEANQHLFIRNEEGKSIGELHKPQEWMETHPDICCDWCGRYWIDVTNPGAREYLAELFHIICNQWGFDYIKIDGQGSITRVYRENRARLFNPKMEPDKAYRTGLNAIISAMKKESFLLNCAMGWDSAGICPGIRTGGDVAANLDGFESAVQSTMKYLFYNNIVWWTDPDVVCLRPPLTLEQARAWVTLIGITGQIFMTSDKMPSLDEKRVELLRRAYPPADIRPMELYEIKNKPSIFNLKINKTDVGCWDIAAIFNWAANWTKKGILSIEDLGLQPAENGYIFFDVWKQKVLAMGSNSINIQLPPLTCRLISIRKCRQHPQFIGSNRHMAQGIDDVVQLCWNEKKGKLSGIVNTVAKEPYHIYFTIPQGWKLLSNDVLHVDKGIGKITLKTKANRAIAWNIDFQKRCTNN